MARRRRGRAILLALLALFVIAQFVPVNRANPPLERQPEWPSAEVQTLFARACADCHSHETKWPWYGYVAPVSWYIKWDVERSRDYFNIHGKDLGDADDAAEEIASGEMPLPQYVLLHPSAKLTDAEKRTLEDGLIAMYGGGDYREETNPASEDDGGSGE